MKKLLALLLSLSTIAAYGMDNQQEIIEPILPQLPPPDHIPADHLALLQQLPELAPWRPREETAQEKLTAKLHGACCKGNLDDVKLALAEGAELESNGMFGQTNTAVYIAAEKGHDHIVVYLRAQGAKFETPKLIIKAKKFGSPELARYFIRMSSENQIAKEIATIDETMLAVFQKDDNTHYDGRRQYLPERIQNHADDESIDFFGYEKGSLDRVLDLIKIKNTLVCALPLKEQILRKTGMVRTALLTGKTLVHDLQEVLNKQAPLEELLMPRLTNTYFGLIADYENNYDKKSIQAMIGALLQAGVSINSYNKMGKTALWIAVEKGDAKLAEFLRSQPGIDANPKNIYSGRTLLQMMKMMPAGKE